MLGYLPAYIPADQLIWVVLTTLYCGITIVTVLRSRMIDTRHILWTAVAILVALAILLLFWPAYAGTIAILLWLIFLLLPGLLQRLISRAVSAHNFTRAQQLGAIVRWLQPFAHWQSFAHLMRANQYMQHGDHAMAEQILAAHPSDTPMGRMVLTQLYRTQHRWPDVLRVTDAEVADEAFGRHSADLNLLGVHLRALGETGDLNRLVSSFATYQHLLPRAPWLIDQARLFVFAFCGRQAALSLIVQQTSLAHWPAHSIAYWTAVCAYAAGERAVAKTKLSELASGDNGLTAAAAQQYLDRLASALPPPIAIDELTLESQEQLAQIEQAYLRAIEAGASSIRDGRLPLATYALLAINLVVFGIEVLRGVLTNPAELYRMGAMAPLTVLMEGAWWRLVSSTFLHINLVHLAFNMLALWFLGRLVEMRLGVRRFLLLYLLAGILSMGMYVLLLQLAWVSPYVIVVGASGSIMGLVGAEAAILLRLWRADHSPIARQHLLRPVMVILLQAGLDLLMPQFSFVGHLSGAFFGFILASLLYRRQPVAYTLSPSTDQMPERHRELL